MDDTWVKIKVQEAQAFTDHINTMDSNIKVSREDSKNNKLVFLDCDILMGTCGNLEIDIPTSRDTEKKENGHLRQLLRPVSFKIGPLLNQYLGPIKGWQRELRLRVNRNTW